MMWSGPGPWWPIVVAIVAVVVGIGVVAATVVMLYRSHDAVAGGRLRGTGIGDGRSIRGVGGIRGIRGIGGGRASGGAGGALPSQREDPLVILRERWARGEIGIEEFRSRLDQLVRTEPEFIKDRPRGDGN